MQIQGLFYHSVPKIGRNVIELNYSKGNLYSLCALVFKLLVGDENVPWLNFTKKLPEKEATALRSSQSQSQSHNHKYARANGHTNTNSTG